MTGQFLFADRVKDTSSAQSSTVITLSNSPPTGFQSFNSGIGDGNFCVYLVSDGTHWEVTYGVYTNLGTTLARAATPYSSSNSGAQVASFSGTVTVACVDPSALMNGDISMIGVFNGFYHNVGVISTSTAAFGLNTACFVPIWIKQPFSSYTVQLKVTIAAGAGGVCAFGLYTHTAANGPTALLGTGQSSIATTSIGAISTSSIAVAQPQMPGLYWACFIPTVAGATVASAGSSGETFFMEFLGAAGAADLTTYQAWRQTASTLPSPASGGTPQSATSPYLNVSVSL